MKREASTIRRSGPGRARRLLDHRRRGRRTIDDHGWETQLAEVTGDPTTGYTATLTVPV